MTNELKTDVNFLNQEQIKCLEGHLRSLFGDAAEFYARCIDLDLLAFAQSKSSSTQYQDYEWVMSDAMRAYNLYEACKRYGIGFEQYKDKLWALWIDLSAKAKTTLESIQPNRKVGRPKNELTELVNKIADYYEGARVAKRGGHFETTITYLLDFLEPVIGKEKSNINDIKSFIKRALATKKRERTTTPMKEI